jgi:hypothetical protein
VDEPVQMIVFSDLDGSLLHDDTCDWRDLISGDSVAEGQITIELRPDQTIGLSNT